MNTEENKAFNTLLETINQLLGEKGCPWDKKQTNTSIIKYLQAESQELLEGLHKKDYQNICEEIGDVLFILLLITSYNSKNKRFSLFDVLDSVNNKLIRRHPHVFADTTYETEEDLVKQWNEIKAQEKRNK